MKMGLSVCPGSRSELWFASSIFFEDDELFGGVVGALASPPVDGVEHIERAMENGCHSTEGSREVTASWLLHGKAEAGQEVSPRHSRSFARKRGNEKWCDLENTK